MIISKLKPCCYECKYPDVDVDSQDMYTVVDLHKVDAVTQCTIYCAHAKVCKTYIESEEE